MIIPLTPLEFQVRAARLFPRNIALIDGDKRFTYAEFNKRANQLANAIHACPDVNQGQIVNVLCPSMHHIMEAYYGIVGAGAVFSPINPNIDAKNVTEILQKSRCSMLIFHGSQAELIDSIRKDLRWTKVFVVIEPIKKLNWAIEYESFISKASPEFSVNLDRIDENSTAEIFWVIKPPGVYVGAMETHRNLYLHAMSIIAAQSLVEEDVILNIIPPYEANGGGLPQAMVAQGGTQVLLRQTNVDSLLKTIERERVTRLYIVPRFLHAVMRDGDLSKYNLTSLKVITPTAAAYTRQLVEEAETRFGVTVEGMYGITELSCFGCYAHAKKALQNGNSELRLNAESSGGLPIIGNRVRVVDKHGKDVPTDGKAEGEILFRGNHIVEGYFDDPGMTDIRFKDGWYHTGDLGTIDGEGYVTVVGQKY